MVNVLKLIECDHCKKKILLRIGVGYSNKQPFDFSCKFCGNYIHGSLNIDDSENELTLTHANILKGGDDFFQDIKQADFAIEIHEDFPIIEIDPVDRGLTPFLRQTLLMDQENFFNFRRDIALFKTYIEDFFPIIERLNNFFINPGLTEISKELSEISSHRNEIEIIKSISQLNELFIIPILNKSVYRKNIELYQKRIIEALEKNKDELESFANTLIPMEILKDQQKQIYEIIKRFSTNFDLFKSAIPLQYYKEQGNLGDKMQLSKNNFDLIKSIEYFD